MFQLSVLLPCFIQMCNLLGKRKILLIDLETNIIQVKMTKRKGNTKGNTKKILQVTVQEINQKVPNVNDFLTMYF